MLAIRHANPSDAAALARIAEDTFRETFGETNSAEDMDLHCQRNYGETIQSAEITNPGMRTLLCEQGSALAGFAQLRSGDTPACVAERPALEIQRFYVAGEWHGKGVAQALMDACMEEAARLGSSAMWLGVWEHNPRAIAFYTRNGFAAVGEHCFPLGNDLQRDVIMLRPLASS